MPDRSTREIADRSTREIAEEIVTRWNERELRHGWGLLIYVLIERFVEALDAEAAKHCDCCARAEQAEAKRDRLQEALVGIARDARDYGEAKPPVGSVLRRFCIEVADRAALALVPEEEER